MKTLLPVVAVIWVAVTLGAAGQQSPGPAAGGQRVAPSPPAASAAAAAPQVEEYRALVGRYCVGCHNERSANPAADPVRLDGVDLANVAADAETWERVVRKLAVGAMPPQGTPHPGEAAIEGFRAFLIERLDAAAAVRPSPGEFVAHRLNRTEYRNAVRDLLAVDFDAVDMLPSDGGEFGFDNIASALKTSPLLLERYLAAALRISAMALGDPDAAPGAAVYTITTEHSQKEHVEGLPLGTRGGMLVRHNFPADAEYVLSGRLVRGVEEGYFGVEGWDEPNDFIVTLDGQEVYTAPVGGPADHGVATGDVNASKVIIDGRMSVRLFVTAGPHEVGFTWRDKPYQDQSVWQPSQRDTQEVHIVTGWPRLRRAIIEGPYNVTGVSDTPSRARLFVCRPAAAAQERGCAERIFTTLAKRAFRRPVAAGDLTAPMAFYDDARDAGRNFDAGIRAGVARILASPSFLFRTEQSPARLAAGAAHPISEIELASRLSFFLWNSIPDDELLDLASAGRLRRPGVLAGQVRRMIADPRADSMIASFTGQWLQLRSLESKVTPDLLMFPHFDDNVRKAFRRETELFFGSVLRDNASVLALLNADYTFLNERLARHYGISGIYGERFRRVPVTDPNRRGLLGHGSLLSVTSVATRTSPVIRGKFILTTIMGLPEPVPPPNVPALDESAPAKRPTSVRERVEMHRRNPVCASCHRSIDPLGFSLENFNAVGQWREATEDGKPVDASGVLQDGTRVDGPVALRAWLTARPEVFVGNVVERLLIYALGRGLEPSDMPVVRDVLARAESDGFRFLPILTAIVESDPFQMRTKDGAAPPALSAQR